MNEKTTVRQLIEGLEIVEKVGRYEVYAEPNRVAACVKLEPAQASEMEKLGWNKVRVPEGDDCWGLFV